MKIALWKHCVLGGDYVNVVLIWNLVKLRIIFVLTVLAGSTNIVVLFSGKLLRLVQFNLSHNARLLSVQVPAISVHAPPKETPPIAWGQRHLRWWAQSVRECVWRLLYSRPGSLLRPGFHSPHSPSLPRGRTLGHPPCRAGHSPRPVGPCPCAKPD